MSYWKALILGIVQGLTEFLPISSSGHLVLLGKLGIGEEDLGLFFVVMLHLATLLAVCIVYRKRIKQLFLHPTSKEAQYLIIATIPTVFIVAVIKFFFNDILQGKWLAMGFMATSVILVLGELLYKKGKQNNYKNAIITGIVQGIAAIPGISRSGSTISAQMMLGIDKEEAAGFSFLLSIPIIIGGTLVEAIGLKDTGIHVDPLPLIVGMVSAFLVGLLVVKFFIRIIKKLSFYPFAAYTFILAIVCLIVL